MLRVWLAWVGDPFGDCSAVESSPKEIWVQYLFMMIALEWAACRQTVASSVTLEWAGLVLPDEKYRRRYIQQVESACPPENQIWKQWTLQSRIARPPTFMSNPGKHIVFAASYVCWLAARLQDQNSPSLGRESRTVYAVICALSTSTRPYRSSPIKSPMHSWHDLCNMSMSLYLSV